MDEKKRIDLQKHVSPKVPKRYLIRIGIYAILVAGLLILIYYMRNHDPVQETGKARDYKDTKEIQLDDFDIDDTTIKDAPTQ